MTDKKYLPSAGFLVVFPIQIIFEPVLHETFLHCGRCDLHIRQYLPFSPAFIPPNILCQIVVRCLPKARKNNPVCTDIIFFVKRICSYCVWFASALELQYKHCFYPLPVITDLNTNHCIRIPLESQVSCWTASLDAGWREGDYWYEMSYWPRYRSPFSAQATRWTVEMSLFRSCQEMLSFSQASTLSVCLIQRVHPRTAHEGPEGEYRYSSTLSLTLALDGDWWSTPHPARFTPEIDSVSIV